MESPAISERVRGEARRIAAAFGLESFKRDTDRTAYIFIGQLFDSLSIRFLVNSATLQLEWIAVNHIKRRGQWHDEVFCWFTFTDGELTVDVVDFNSPHLAAALVAGIYRLGFDKDEVWGELRVSLTAHEKLELRRDFPREYWPQNWIDEETRLSSAT